MTSLASTLHTPPVTSVPSSLCPVASSPATTTRNTDSQKEKLSSQQRAALSYGNRLRLNRKKGHEQRRRRREYVQLYKIMWGCLPKNDPLNEDEYTKFVAPQSGVATESLPVGPIRDWVRVKLEKEPMLELAARLRTSERTLLRIQKDSQTITLKLADQLLTNDGNTMLWELYPELYE